MPVRLALVLLLILSPLTFAQPLADRIPSDAILYVGWQGSEALGGAYAKSHLNAVMSDSNLPQFVSDFLPRLAERFEKEQDDADAQEAARAIRLITSVASPLWRKAGALYFAGVDFERETPRLAVIVDAGNEARALLDSTTKAVAEAKPPVEVDMEVVANRFFVLSIGMKIDGRFGALLGGPQGVAPAPALASHKPFMSAMSQVQKQPALALYVDGEAAWKLVEQRIAGAGDAEEKDTWAKARESLGLSNLKRFAWTAGFEGEGWATAAFLEAPAPRSGLASLFDGKPISDDILRAVPQTATWMNVSRFDLNETFSGIRTAFGKADAEMKQGFDQAMGMAKMFSGIDLQADLFEPLGPEWAVYIDPVNGGGGNYLGFIAVNRPDNVERLEQALVKLATSVNNALAGQLAEEDVSIAVRQAKVGELDVHFVSLPAVAPAWAVKDGHLYFGLYPQSVVSAAAHVAEKRPTILENEQFARLRGRLAKQRGASSIAFADLPKTAGGSYPTFLALTQFGIGMADMMGMELPPLIVPPLHRIQRHLSPAGSASWTDDAGWHYRSDSPFAGSEIVATDANLVVAYQATLASILVPALSAAKERANRVKCASNMRQIAQGVLLYANDHKGKYPPDLGTLAAYAKGELHWSVFGCPTNGGADDPGAEVLADDEKYKQWVNESSHYVYVGGKLNAAAGAEQILAYEQEDNHEEEGMNIVFADGHVEWFTYDRAMQLIEKQNGAQ